MATEQYSNNFFKEIQIFASPLTDIQSTDDAYELFSQFGWNLEIIFTNYKSNIDNLINLIRVIKDTALALEKYTDNPPKKLIDYADTITGIIEIFNEVGKIGAKIEKISFQKINEKDFLSDIINGLSLIYLAKSPVLYDTLSLLKIIDSKEPEFVFVDNGTEKGEVLRVKNLLPKFKLDKINKIIGNPKKYFKNAYSKEINQLQDELLSYISDILLSLGFYTFQGIADEGTTQTKSKAITAIQIDSLSGMLTFYKETNDTRTSHLGATVSLLSDKDNKLKGVAVFPFGTLGYKHSFDQWLMDLDVKGVTKGFQITKDDFSLIDSSPSSLNASFSLFQLLENNKKLFTLGNEGSTQLTINTASFMTSLTKELSSREYLIESTLHDIHLTIERPESNGFLGKVIPKEGIHSKFDLTIGWSSLDDIYFRGSAGLDFILPIHESIGPIELQTITVKLMVSDKKTNLTAGFAVKGKLGPVLFTFGDFGLTAKHFFTPPTTDEKNIDFQRPTKIGISIESGIITGGGYLAFNREDHRYTGILSLNFRSLELSAICILTTRLPDNKKGYSLLVSINVAFQPVIQLSFGYTLNGVGGLIGINRTMRIDTLRERLGDGLLDSIMFPENVISNADTIISNLRTIFPPEEKHYVVAPFLKIGWSSILELDIGLLLEFPFKNRIIVIGDLWIFLPTKEAALVDIRVAIYGDFNFAEEYIRIEGILYESSIVGIPLTGGFAFVLSWGDKPQFLLSVGGYHPSYKKPASFPTIPRLQAIIQNEYFQLTCQYYQAITSNSFQIGFLAELYLSSGKAIITGFLGFDALIIFDPFYFETHIGISVDIRYKGRSFGGIGLSFVLIGPKPWKAKGYARIRILFFKKKIRFSYHWDQEAKSLLSTIKPNEILAALQEQLQTPHNWSAKLPKGFITAETLRSIEDDEVAIILHPSGYLEVRQTVVPLNLNIEKYANSLVEGKPKFAIGNDERVTLQPIKEYFARGQFEELSNAEKLSFPDFEEFDAGYSFAQSLDINLGLLDEEEIIISTGSEYEEIVLDENLKVITSSSQQSPHLGQGQKPPKSGDYHIDISSTRTKRFNARPEASFALSDIQPQFEEHERYFIVSKDDFSLHTNTSFATQAEAREHLTTQLADEQQQYQIVTASTYYEMTNIAA